MLGADGFIGSHVTRSVLDAGGSVVGLCSKPPLRLEDVECDRLRLGTLDWWSRDAVDKLRSLLELADTAVMLLYRPPGPSPAPEHESRVNALAARHVSGLAADLGIRLVFASSADVYGPWYDQPVSESQTPRPVTPYARAKLEAESFLAADRLAGASSVSLRIATVFGPGEDGPRAIPAFTRAYCGGRVPIVHGDGGDVRDYVHVTDVAAAIVNACVVPDLPPLVNVGSGVGRSTREVLHAVARLLNVPTGAQYEPSPRPPSCLVLDAGLAHCALGFEPRGEFDALLGEEVAWLRRRHDRKRASRDPTSTT